MWQQQVQGIKKFQDLDISDMRSPLIRQLQSALVSSKPKNPLHFIKKWAQKQMNDMQQSDTEKEKEEDLSKKIKEARLRRRNAIVMAKIDRNEHWIHFFNRGQVIKNEECKSRIMLCLREIPFLTNLGWDDIHNLVNQSEVREYEYDQIFVGRGDWINRLYILLQGQITKVDKNGKTSLIREGNNMFMESIISLVQSPLLYKVTSQKAWICGIEAFRIYQTIQEVNKMKEQQFEKMLMGVGIFNCLDRQQLYKLICSVRPLPFKKANEVILEKDSPVQTLFFVLKGEFLTCKLNLEGQITSFHAYREGQTFGQHWLINPSESECSIIAKTDGLLATISKTDVEASIAPIERLQQRKKARKLNK